jgi:hypothetical protein
MRQYRHRAGIPFAVTYSAMPHFTKQILTVEGLQTFCFDRVYNVNGLRYKVSVQDGKSYCFMMNHKNETWIIDHIKDGLPGWVLVLEKDLSNAIKEHSERY